MDLTEFDRTVDEVLDSWNCPGVAIAVVHGDDVLYRRTAGMADLAERRPITPETRFALASITKGVTAASAAILVDDGKLDWDRPACEDLPGFILDDPYATRHVSLRDMLAHRTGLPRHDYAAWRLPLSRAEFLSRMRHLKLSTSLRGRFQYNNLMYAMAAHLVETTAAQRWESLVQDRLFAPLGMQASNFGPEFPRALNPLALGYRLERDYEGRFKEHVPMPFGKHTDLSPGPAGALFSTLADMTQWLRLCVNDGRHGTQTIVSRASMREIRSAHIAIPVHEMAYSLSGLMMLSYGLGWYVRPYPYAAKTLVYHDGNVEGHSAHIGFVPESKVGVVVMVNAASSVVPTVLAREALDRMLELPAQDWSTRFHRIHDPIHQAAGKARQASASAGTSGPVPPSSHAFEDFEGHYAADGYPDFAVRFTAGALEACTVGSMPWSRLEHVGYDIFEWYVPAWDETYKARFTLSESGEIEAVTLPISGEASGITFKRRPVTVDIATLAALEGDYEGNIAGLRFQVRVAGGKLYWTELGTPKLEASARRVQPDALEFSTKRGRVVFLKEDAGWRRVQFKTDSGIFDALRVAS